MSRPKVYLAGPISGCNDDQMRVWRRDVRRGFGDEFDFIDPTDSLIRAGGSHHEVVQADVQAIRNADAVLANMWRESVGTSFGVLHAHLNGKIVVVNDPNLIRSRMLAFYADAVEQSLPASLNAIRTFLRSERLIREVVKRDGRTEPFSRSKLSKAIRHACIDAKADDIVPTRAIVSRTLGLLLDNVYEERSVSSEDIEGAVWQAMAELAADPLHETDYDAVRQAWERHGKPIAAPLTAPGQQLTLALPQVHTTPLKVKVHTIGGHSTIWGKKGVGDGARAIFDAIRCVDGITEIVLGPFSNSNSPPAKPHVRIQASKTPHLIDGRCYDKGVKGTLQTFQVRVADPTARDAVLQVLRQHLEKQGHIRPALG